MWLFVSEYSFWITVAVSCIVGLLGVLIFKKAPKYITNIRENNRRTSIFNNVDSMLESGEIVITVFEYGGNFYKLFRLVRLKEPTFISQILLPSFDEGIQSVAILPDNTLLVLDLAGKLYLVIYVEPSFLNRTTGDIYTKSKKLDFGEYYENVAMKSLDKRCHSGILMTDHEGNKWLFAKNMMRKEGLFAEIVISVRDLSEQECGYFFGKFWGKLTECDILECLSGEVLFYVSETGRINVMSGNSPRVKKVCLEDDIYESSKISIPGDNLVKSTNSSLDKYYDSQKPRSPGIIRKFNNILRTECGNYYFFENNLMEDHRKYVLLPPIRKWLFENLGFRIVNVFSDAQIPKYYIIQTECQRIIALFEDHGLSELEPLKGAEVLEVGSLVSFFAIKSGLYAFAPKYHAITYLFNAFASNYNEFVDSQLEYQEGYCLFYLGVIPSVPFGVPSKSPKRPPKTSY